MSPSRFAALMGAFALTTFAAIAADGTYFPPPDSEGGWRTLTDPKEILEKTGVRLERLEAAYTTCERSSPNGGLLVVKNGYLIFERYFGRASRNANPDMASTGKAFTSVACGTMLQEFKEKIPEGLETKVFTEKYLPEALPLDDPRKADIKLGHLLCMTAGTWGEGEKPSNIILGKQTAMLPKPGQNIRDIDGSSLRIAMWAEPGAGYSYSSPSPHIASMVLRRVTGMELQDYIQERFAKPMGWGPWGYCLQRGDFKMPHANGAGSTALHATDALRMAYCWAHNGQWKGQQLIPAEYLKQCQTMSPYNPHTPFSLQFEQNSDGHILAAPRDAFYKSGAGGFSLYAVPSLDLVIYKLGGKDGQYDPALTGLPQPEVSHARDGWTPAPTTAFYEGVPGDSLRRVLEYVCLSVVK